VLKAVDEFVRIREITRSVKVSLKCPYSRSCRRRLTVLDFKGLAFSGIYGHFQQHLYCACAETVIYKLSV